MGAAVPLFWMNYNFAATRKVLQNGLKDAYKKDFLIGAAVGYEDLVSSDDRFHSVLRRDFNSLTLENAMKWESVHPSESRWNFDKVDAFVAYGKAQNMSLVGHTLVAHTQIPESVFKDEKGQAFNSARLSQTMQGHIETYMDRYKDDIHYWDVVNEVTTKNDWLKNDWYNMLGPSYIQKAFQFAHEANPHAHLIYNDYSMFLSKKRELIVDMLRKFKLNGTKIHGIGLQCHSHLKFPRIDALEKSIRAFAREGVRVHITELDLDILPYAYQFRGKKISKEFMHSQRINPYPDRLPERMAQKQAERYEQLFELFLRCKDDIERVTFWGVSDKSSWKNNFPVIGRTNYPLLFDSEYQPKRSYFSILRLKSRRYSETK